MSDPSNVEDNLMLGSRNTDQIGIDHTEKKVADTEANDQELKIFKQRSPLFPSHRPNVIPPRSPISSHHRRSGSSQTRLSITRSPEPFGGYDDCVPSMINKSPLISSNPNVSCSPGFNPNLHSGVLPQLSLQISSRFSVKPIHSTSYSNVSLMNNNNVVDVECHDEEINTVPLAFPSNIATVPSSTPPSPPNYDQSHLHLHTHKNARRLTTSSNLCSPVATPNVNVAENSNIAPINLSPSHSSRSSKSNHSNHYAMSLNNINLNQQPFTGLTPQTIISMHTSRQRSPSNRFIHRSMKYKQVNKPKQHTVKELEMSSREDNDDDEEEDDDEIIGLSFEESRQKRGHNRNHNTSNDDNDNDDHGDNIVAISDMDTHSYYNDYSTLSLYRGTLNNNPIKINRCMSSKSIGNNSNISATETAATTANPTKSTNNKNNKMKNNTNTPKKLRHKSLLDASAIMSSSSNVNVNITSNNNLSSLMSQPIQGPVVGSIIYGFDSSVAVDAAVNANATHDDTSRYFAQSHSIKDGFSIKDGLSLKDDGNFSYTTPAMSVAATELVNNHNHNHNHNFKFNQSNNPTSKYNNSVSSTVDDTHLSFSTTLYRRMQLARVASDLSETQSEMNMNEVTDKEKIMVSDLDFEREGKR